MKVILDSLLKRQKIVKYWKVDNFEDENLRNKTENNDKNRQNFEI